MTDTTTTPRVRGFAAALLAVGCALQPERPSQPPVAYEVGESSTAVANIAVVSPESLYAWNSPALVDHDNLIYSAKQWREQELPVEVSIWRSPIVGGAATKLVSAGPGEQLLMAYTDPQVSRIYFSLGCAIFSTGKSGVGGRTRHASSSYCDHAPTPLLDDARVLFTACTLGTDCFAVDSNVLWLMDRTGTNLLQLRQGFDARVAPDGSKLAFSYQGDIWSMNIDGSQATDLLPSDDYRDSAPAFSADGTRIVFAREHRVADGWELADIWMMNADGSNVAQLTLNPATDLAPYLGPDDSIYFLSNRGPLVGELHPSRVWRMQLVDAAPPETTFAEPSEPALSPSEQP